MLTNNHAFSVLVFFAAMAVALVGVGMMASAQTTTTLTCAPATQNVTLGNNAAVTASGGDGTYTWSAPGLNIVNPTGTGFSANYASIGMKTITVTSAGQTASCTVNVLASSATSTPTTTSTTPGLPSTGEPAE